MQNIIWRQPYLHRQGIVEQVFAEPKEFNILNLETVTDPMRVQIQAFLEKYGKMSAKELTEHRYQRFRKF